MNEILKLYWEKLSIRIVGQLLQAEFLRVGSWFGIWFGRRRVIA